jgi:hypothetical protein
MLNDTRSCHASLPILIFKNDNIYAKLQLSDAEHYQSFKQKNLRLHAIFNSNVMISSQTNEHEMEKSVKNRFDSLRKSTYLQEHSSDN